MGFTIPFVTESETVFLVAIVISSDYGDRNRGRDGTVAGTANGSEIVSSPGKNKILGLLPSHRY